MRRLDNIDLRLLRVFMTLVETGGFAEAQIALNLSPSTLSTHLSALERRLGGELCKRGRGGFRVTNFGRSTYAAVKQLFEDIETFEARIGRDRGQLVGRLRLGIVDGIISHPKLALQSALGRFMADAEGVFIELRLGTPQQLEQAVVRRRPRSRHRPVLAESARRRLSDAAQRAARALLRRRPSAFHAATGRDHAGAYRSARCFRCAATGISTISTGPTIRARAPASCRWRRRR